MRNFQLIATNIDIVPLVTAVQLDPSLWDQHRYRTTYTGTPHGDVSDIWLRFSDMDKTTDPDNLDAVQSDLEPVPYRAWWALPQARVIIFDLMRRVEAIKLERVIITRLKPGGVILPHADTEGEYTARADGARFHVVLQGLPGSLYHCGGEVISMPTGTAWWFQHRAMHSVENNSADDRIHMLVDFRT